nr:unnamed protein product [Spirometra erinaceieuropaei]
MQFRRPISGLLQRINNLAFVRGHIRTKIRKRTLDEHDCTCLLQLCAEVKNECRTCISLATLAKDYRFQQAAQLSPSLQYHLREVIDLLDETDFTFQLAEVYSFAPNYDFHEIRANGFRSFLSLVSICLARILTYLRNLNRQPSSTWSHNTEQSLIAYLRCLGELVHCILLIREFPSFAPRGSLFPSAKYPQLPFRPSTMKTIEETLFKTEPTRAMTARYNELIDCFDLIQQDAFYGRCIGFYFSPSAQGLYRVLSSVMAGFADSFQASQPGGMHWDDAANDDEDADDDDDDDARIESSTCVPSEHYSSVTSVIVPAHGFFRPMT